MSCLYGLTGEDSGFRVGNQYSMRAAKHIAICKFQSFRISGYFRTNYSVGTPQMRMGVYDHDSGPDAPKNLIAVTGVITHTQDGGYAWFTGELDTPVDWDIGSIFWLACQLDYDGYDPDNMFGMTLRSVADHRRGAGPDDPFAAGFVDPWAREELPPTDDKNADNLYLGGGLPNSWYLPVRHS